MHVSDVGLLCFERLSPPSESFIFGAQLTGPRIYWEFLVVHGDWDDGAPLVPPRFDVAAMCGTPQSLNNDVCLDLNYPTARAEQPALTESLQVCLEAEPRGCNGYGASPRYLLLRNCNLSRGTIITWSYESAPG